MENIMIHNPSELTHWGVKGMKWGVRRYQNKDGTLTDAGKKRMYRDQFDMEGKEKKEKNKYVADANRWVKEDLDRSKQIADAGSNMARNLKQLNDTSMKNKPKTKLDLSEMSDKELRDRINREFLERQYNDMFAPKNVSRGQERTSQILETAGTVLAVAASALTIAQKIKEIRG